MVKPRLISLYSGAGGLDYGFEAAGFDTGVAVEMDHDCCETLRRSRPHWAVIERSIFASSRAYGRAANALSCARRNRAAATNFIARVICWVFFTERMRRRKSRSVGMSLF